MFQFRQKDLAKKIIQSIQERNKEYRFMHVCGTHQDTLVRHGLDQMLLDSGIDVREGPGCPVCVSTTREIEIAREFVRHGKTVAVYGDMLRAPGVKGSLETERAAGGSVVVVYSIENAVEFALSHPEKEVVFMAVGFETTMPSTAVIVSNSPPPNFSVYSMHKLTPPAVEGIARLGNVKLDGMILPGHVSAIIGSEPWEQLAATSGLPQVVAGFEPLDLLMGIHMLIGQKERNDPKVEIEYGRVVKHSGNELAKRAIYGAFEPADTEWRGFPVLPGSGMKLRKKYEDIDAEKRYEDIVAAMSGRKFPDPPGCKCAEVIRGEIYPWDCPLFGKVCNPDRPIGPCMVSSEGACAIEFKYGKMRNVRMKAA